jgi:PTH2 family peptidyl-tRNA hydrolase
MNTKQIIVIRKDLNMSKGKSIAQGSHASMAFLTKTANIMRSFPEKFLSPNYSIWESRTELHSDHVEEVRHWLHNSFRKITCYVNSEQELVDLHYKAMNDGLISHLIEDNGTTEFNGVKTKTCIAIGPHWDNKFEGITDNLPLL